MLANWNRWLLVCAWLGCSWAAAPATPLYVREAYLNGTAYIRLYTALALDRHISVSFRSCHGGELFSQRNNGNFSVSLEVRSDGLVFAVTIGPQRYESRLRAALLDNVWHSVTLLSRLGNLTLSAAGHQQVIANATFTSELVRRSSESRNSSVLIVGNNFRGCILDGPGIVFNASLLQANNVEWGRCRLNTLSCVKSDYCLTEPCMRHGTCVSRADRYECRCTPRYSGNNCEIDNGSPCDREGVNPCQHNGRCNEDTSGNYVCVCDPAYTGQHCETELTPHLCENNPCFNDGACTESALPGRYQCICQPGYSGENCEMNVNECASAPCLNGGTCIDGVNNYTCVCGNIGYRGADCEENIDECAAFNPCLNHGTCFDTYGSYTCECLAGYEGANCEMRLDECSSGPCQHGGVCQDLVGSYRCSCAAGYEGRSCELDVDDCASIICPINAVCVDGVDSYQCLCRHGFIGTPPDCAEVDNCLTMPCLNGGTCTALNNCTCPPGFTGPLCQTSSISACDLSPCLHGGACQDLGTGMHRCECAGTGYTGAACERAINMSCADVPCQHGGVCVPVGAAGAGREYRCDCLPGFAGVLCEAAECLDGACAEEQQAAPKVDRCASSGCQNNATCETDNVLDAAPACICAPGFTGRYCELDVDECAAQPLLCNNGICQNSRGGYACFCRPGFTGDNCELDVDECASSPCKNGALCDNRVNSFFCSCPPGYTGKVCSVDIDECGSSPCFNGSTCVDKIAEFECVCPAGMTGRLCEINIDECESSPCQNEGACVDQVNGYLCDCAGTGFHGTHCEHNIDDCLEDACTNGATCIDQVNRFECLCHPGFTGKSCEVDIDECESVPCKNGGTCLEHSNATLYETDLDMMLDVFQQPFDLAHASGYSCLCVPGVTGADCEVNINECDSSPCQAAGTCKDLLGGYFCECEAGFEGVHCETDVDECLRYTPCVHGTCMDRRADYLCDCIPGFGGKNCSVKLTGCDGESCLNNGTCKPYLENETKHRFNCSCANGFHGQVCEKVTTMSFSGEAYVLSNTSRDEGYDISFRFRTTTPYGRIAFGQGLTLYSLELVDGRLNLQSSILNKWDGVFIGSMLNDSEWHKVFVAINNSHLVLAANEEQTIYPINWREDSNVTHTSFPTTYLGGAASNMQKVFHHTRQFVGCMQDVVINGVWVLPSGEQTGVETVGVEAGCPREEQCVPNPCQNDGRCTDLWRNFTCACARPFLGHKCQYTLTAATFGHENTSASHVLVRVGGAARRSVRTIVDISMFVRTRAPRGLVFYLGTEPGAPDETFLAAQLAEGELLVRLQFNGTQEQYTVGGVKLSDGNNHLIQVVRNVTLVQVRINDTEYFRKTISASGQLDVQVLYLGGMPGGRFTRQTDALSEVTGFKGIIQDVQISNGAQTMVVEFFPLSVADLDLPPSFGQVEFDSNAVLEGVVSDDACRDDPCEHNGTCHVTWNDFRCECPRGYKGKRCQDMEFCQLQDCPSGSSCRNLDNGYECVANMTFDGATTSLHFSLNYPVEAPGAVEAPLDSIEVNYRSQTGGTILYVGSESGAEFVSLSVFRDEVALSWRLDNSTQAGHVVRFRKDAPDGNWTSITVNIRDGAVSAGFTGSSEEAAAQPDFPLPAWLDLLHTGHITLGSGLVAPAHGEHNEVEVPGAVEQTGAYFKGCLGEVRIGGLLLPYFTPSQLSAPNTSSLATSSDYFLLSSAPAPDVGCRLCFERECLNGGACADAEHEYECACAAGYAGADCGTDVDECAESECQNNATCVDGVAQYTCLCVVGYTGEHCEEEIDECASSPCQHNGTCVDLLGSFECRCGDAYVGTRCEYERLVTCEEHPCHDAATCIDVPNPATRDNFTCSCSAGYEGRLCDVAYCLVTPCLHGACDETGAVPTCQCQPGYEGRHCEVDVDDCAPVAGQPACKHGGRCEDRVAGKHCDCADTGFTGLECEVDVDECSLGLAECGQGRCVNVPGRYNCACDLGACGQACQFSDPCNEERCLNGGLCIPQCIEQPHFACECKPGWNGHNCTEQADGGGSSGVDIAIIVAPILGTLFLIGAISVAFFVSMARKKRATRGTYSPSSQEYCNPRVEMDNVMKPPPEERLI